MAETDKSKILVSLQNLTDYDALIKKYSDDADSAISGNLTTEVNRAKGVEGTLTDLTTEAKGTLVAAINEVDAHADAAQGDADALETLVGTIPASATATTIVGYAEEVAAAAKTGAEATAQSKIEALDATQSQTAGTDGLALSITEVDGKITAISGSIAANTYDAYGAASGVQGDTTETVKSVNDKITTLNGAVDVTGSVLQVVKDNAKDATYKVDGETTMTIAQGIADAKASATTASVVTVEKQATAETGYATTYYVKQNGTKVGDSINIAKDWILKDVSIKTCTEADKPVEGYKVGDRYFDFEFNVKTGETETSTHTYLKVEEMYDAYTSGSATTDPVVVVVDNDNNTISATVTDSSIARAKIDSTFEADIAAVETALGAKTSGAYTTVANQIKAAVEDLDATVTNAVTGEGATQPDVVVSVTETDGKLTAVSASVTSNRFDAYGAASDVQTAVTGTADDPATSLTLNGLSKKIANVQDSLVFATSTDIQNLFKTSES